MPIKIPKGFNRRKSSGNGLDLDPDSALPAQSSFRVLERPPDNTKAFDPPNNFKRALARRPNTSPSNQARRPSYGDGSESSNRGSGNTNYSGDAHSSNRFSYASTVPSSVESRSQDDLPLRPRDPHTFNQNGNSDVTYPSLQDSNPKSSFSLKAAGKALSFGPRTAKSSGKENNSDSYAQRHRTMTESSYASESTATPPKLDVGGPELGSNDLDFGDLFKRRSTILEEQGHPPALNHRSESDSVLPTDRQAGRFAPEQPRTMPDYRTNAFDRTQEPPARKCGSPYSWRSNESQERLMSSPRQPPRSYSPGRPKSFDIGSGFNGDDDAQVVMDAVLASRALEAQHAPSPPPLRESRTEPDLGRPQRPGFPTTSPPNAAHRAHPPSAGERNFKRPPSAWTGRQSPHGMFGSRDIDGLGLDRPLMQGQVSGDDEPLFDAPQKSTLARSSARASALLQSQSNKVMTPAEFEQYKHQKEDATEEDGNQSEKSDDSEVYEDDDETERNRQLAKQRRKQEANLAVYRQQMMKVTGEQPSDLPDLPRRAPLERASQTVPNFLSSLSFDKPAEGDQNGASKKSSDDDDDEDVPLGVLQAHGFPNKSRPPSQTLRESSTGSIPRPQSQATAYPPPTGSSRNEPTAGGGGALPAFAKKLPSDPYIGASIVKPPIRESLGYNQNDAVIPGQPAPPPNLPPGGLVGVIAGEERAKATRRGSPNTRGTYDSIAPQQSPMALLQQQQMLQQMPPQTAMPGVNMPPGPMPTLPAQHSMSPGEQSQVNMNNQMAQMMQMQMQWMQQMMQIQGVQQPNSQQQVPPPQLPQQQFPSQTGFLAPPESDARPNSTGSGGSSSGGHQHVQSNVFPNPRTSFAPSMMGGIPNSSAQSVQGMPIHGPGYAPSIAPSERSNVGQPSRYRPVTPAGGNSHQSRTSTMSAHTVQGLAGQRDKSQTRSMSQPRAHSMDAPSALQKSTIRAIDKPKHGGAGSDDDDDEGWAEIQKKRQQRQSRWRSNKINKESMPSQQEGGLEGLYYEN